MRLARSAGLLVLAAAAGCGGDRRVAEGEEPIAALQVAHASERYSTEYWQAQAAMQSAVWSVAVQFCGTEGRDHARYPNCRAVQTAGRGAAGQR